MITIYFSIFSCGANEIRDGWGGACICDDEVKKIKNQKYDKNSCGISNENSLNNEIESLPQTFRRSEQFCEFIVNTPTMGYLVLGIF